LGRILIFLGVGVVVVGLLLLLLGKAGLTRLPGDLVYRGKGATVYVPIGLSILASIVLTILLNLFLRR
jgi:hypothetical protein